MTTSRDGTIVMFSTCISAFVVMEMERKKILKKGLLTGKVLRLFGMTRDLEEPPIDEEIIHVPIPTDANYSYRKEIKTALLEAERRKAEALMESQKRRFIC